MLTSLFFFFCLLLMLQTLINTKRINNIDKIIIQVESIKNFTMSMDVAIPIIYPYISGNDIIMMESNNIAFEIILLRRTNLRNADFNGRAIKNNIAEDEM
jgi:uncharacterized membrane protein (DUF441 family)